MEQLGSELVTKTPDAAAVLDTTIRSRRTVRAFKPDPVPQAQLVQIIELARMAPSNFNSQPWRVHVLSGEPKRALSEATLRAHFENTHPPFSPFPQPLVPECAERVEHFASRYYGTLRIERADSVSRTRQTGRNFAFFDAPVGLIFTIDSTLTRHSWLDCGLFIQNLMLAAHVRGLATCPQVSFVRFQSIIAQHLSLGPEEAVACGMSLGYPDEKAALNHMEMPREPVAVFTRWFGFPKPAGDG